MSRYGLDNLPYGVFSRPGEAPRVGVRLDDAVVDLSDVDQVFRQPSLAPLMALGRPQWTFWRAEIRRHLDRRIPLADVRMHLPFEVADYTD